MSKAKTPDKQAEAATNEPRWPVAQGSELTLDHISQKLRDDINRPLLRQVRALAQVLVMLQDRRNDLQAGLARLGKEGDKDSHTLNAAMSDPMVVAALQSAGFQVRQAGAAPVGE